jgi:hypothetical protein
LTVDVPKLNVIYPIGPKTRFKTNKTLGYQPCPVARQAIHGWKKESVLCRARDPRCKKGIKRMGSGGSGGIIGLGLEFSKEKSERNRFVSDLSKKYDVIFFRNNWLKSFIYRMFFSSFEWFVLVFGFVFCLFLLKNALFFRIMILQKFNVKSKGRCSFS